MQQEEKYFLQKSSTKWARETYSKPLFFKKKKKTLTEVKQVVCSFNILR